MTHRERRSYDNRVKSPRRPISAIAQQLSDDTERARVIATLLRGYCEATDEECAKCRISETLRRWRIANGGINAAG
jgi:hypothetical protein